MTFESMLEDFDFQQLGKIDSKNECLCSSNIREGFDADASIENYTYWMRRFIDNDIFGDFRLEPIWHKPDETYFLVVKSKETKREYHLRGDTLITYKIENGRNWVTRKGKEEYRDYVSNNIVELTNMNVQICHENIINPHFCMNMPPLPHISKDCKSINSLRATAYGDRPDLFLKTKKAVFDIVNNNKSNKTDISKLLENDDKSDFVKSLNNYWKSLRKPNQPYLEAEEAEVLLIDLLWQAKDFFGEFGSFRRYCEVFQMSKFIDEKTGEVTELPYDFYEYVKEGQRLLGRL
ncbi:MAG: hypothetical protein LBC96_04780 [Lachnospiraceae bacterium]|jgi:hypothetical protein|nr:hypothetical protein [Lachnospiraceae bacterium]